MRPLDNRLGELFAHKNSLSVQPYQAGTWLGGTSCMGARILATLVPLLDERLVRVAPAASCAAVPSTAARLVVSLDEVLSVRSRFLQ